MQEPVDPARLLAVEEGAGGGGGRRPAGGASEDLEQSGATRIPTVTSSRFKVSYSRLFRLI